MVAWKVFFSTIYMILGSTWLANRYFDEPCLKGEPDVIGSKLDREKFREMIDEFYGYHGWDENGHPTPKTLMRLNLDNEPSYLL